MIGYAAYFKDLAGNEKILSRDSIVKIFALYERIFNKINEFKQILEKTKNKFDFNIDKAILHAYEKFIHENIDELYKLVQPTNQFKNKEQFSVWALSRFPMYEFFSSVIEKNNFIKTNDLKNINEDQLYAMYKEIVEQSRNVRSIYSLGHLDNVLLDFLAVNFFGGNGYLIFFLENYLKSYSNAKNVEQERKQAEDYVEKILSKYYKGKTEKTLDVEEKILSEREQSERKALFRQKMREVRNMLISPVKNIVLDTYQQIRKASPILRFFEWGAKSMFKLAKITDERFNKGRLGKMIQKIKTGNILSSIFKKKEKNAKEMPQEDFERLRNELSESIYKKQYERLSDKEREHIDKISNLIKNDKEKKAEIVEAVLEAKNLNINQNIEKNYDLESENEKDKKKKGLLNFKSPKMRSKKISKKVIGNISDTTKSTIQKLSISKFGKLKSKKPKSRKKDIINKIRRIEKADYFCKNIMSPASIKDQDKKPVLTQAFPKEEEVQKTQTDDIKNTLSEVYDSLDSADKKEISKGEKDLREISKKKPTSKIKDFVQKTKQKVKERIEKTRENIRKILRKRGIKLKIDKKSISKSVKKVRQASDLSKVQRITRSASSLSRPTSIGSRIPGAKGFFGRLGGGFGRLGGAASRVGGSLLRGIGSVARIGSAFSRIGPILGFLATPAGWIVLAIVIAIVMAMLGVYVYYMFKKLKYLFDPVIEMAYGKGAKSAFEAQKLAEQEEKIGEGLKKRMEAIRDVKVSEGNKSFISEYVALSSGDFNESNVYTTKSTPEPSKDNSSTSTQSTAKQSNQNSKNQNQKDEVNKNAQKGAETSQQARTSRAESNSYSKEAENTNKLTQETVESIQKRAEARSQLTAMSSDVSTKGTMALDHASKSNVNSEY